MRTQVVIVGAGPAGLTLAHLLHRQGIDCLVLEARAREHIETRVRAGVLEQPTVDLLDEIGLAGRLRVEGMTHHGIRLRFDHAMHRIDFADLTGAAITVYAQQELVKDLVAARLAGGQPILFDVDDVRLDGVDTDRPRVRFRHDGRERTVDCDVIAGCDGFHGISRASIPAGVLTVHERVYPFAWLGILARTRPSCDELVYARHPDGFALHSMRGPEVTRQYLQVPAGTDLADWPDERIWTGLRRRLGHGDGLDLEEGPIFDKSLAPMRSFVVEPMRYGRLFLLGDAAHIVPATGAKGLNLAVADARVLSYGLGHHYATGRWDELDRYTARCLRRVWQVQQFSWWMTAMLHRIDGTQPFDERLRAAELDRVVSSRAAATTLAENYVGLPFATGWVWRG
ncbi:4-hydroxybenzoate 3-monooxygenase [Polymorphospora lycopeni]|uniref:4-hydroxybenzoate 3-monooxygenase n=1 Tax=Polymorphospora lycopeni TaxID=3140240 RepID=A0ABV5CT73_9ACTN